ncbi:MAG: phosphoenolpyruvate--protein phosphotransferase [Gammaproteobacteria bacterium]|nr:phosphoenolpyruvate--protein phosphotransferase [Gammaproteobacteria bacterium]
MLDVLRRIILEVNAAPDLDQALNIIVQRVKKAIQVDVASVYLSDFQLQQHILMATDGFNPQAVGRVRLAFGEGLISIVTERAEPLNLEDGSAHPRYRRIVETGEERYHGFLGVPIIQHKKVLGVLVVRQRAMRKFAENEETFMVTLAAQLAGAIIHAEASGGFARLFKDVGGAPFTLKGLPGAPGVAIGRALVVYPPANLEAIPDRKVADPDAEEASFRAAIADVQREVRAMSRQMADTLPPEELVLFDALALMVGSDDLVEGVVGRIHVGNWAPGALRDTIHELLRAFEEMEDPYLRERATDIRDLGRRILTRLQAEAPVQMLGGDGRVILVGEDVAAAHLSEVPTAQLAGVVSARGSSSSHVAILARALGIPAVMGVADLPVSRLESQQLVIDGYRGQVFVRPTPAALTEFQRLEREEEQLRAGLQELASLPAITPDGVRVPLYANTGLLADISPSMRSGAEGVGLYRTEVPFLVRDRFPGEDEQMHIYRQVLEGFAPRPVILRTLDIGGDKELPYFPVREDNPFLGWRGIRITLDHPEIFLTQLRAILRASIGLYNLRLMLPMISDVNEVDESLALIRRAHSELIEDGMPVTMPPVGVMIEVPSAVYQIDALAQRVAFFSVGTNDLTQYLLAVDRNNTRVAELYQTLHPAVVRALAQIVDGAHRHGKPVGVCGELAGDPAAAIVLLGLGVDSLSMSVGSLLRVKSVVRTFTKAHAHELAQQVLQMEKEGAIRALLNNAMEEVGLGGLVRAGR